MFKHRDDDPFIATLPQAAESLGVNLPELRRYIKEGWLKSVWIDRKKYITSQALWDYAYESSAECGVDLDDFDKETN